MFDPKLDDFISILKDNQLKKMMNNRMFLENLFYYIKEENSKMVFDRVKGTEYSSDVFKNLLKLLPVSYSIVKVFIDHKHYGKDILKWLRYVSEFSSELGILINKQLKKVIEDKEFKTNQLTVSENLSKISESISKFEKDKQSLIKENQKHIKQIEKSEKLKKEINKLKEKYSIKDKEKEFESNLKNLQDIVNNIVRSKEIFKDLPEGDDEK